MASPTKASEPQVPFSLKSLQDFQKYALALPKLQAMAFRAALGQQREMLNFLKQRYDRDFELSEKIVEAKEVKDIYEAMVEFFQCAGNEYVTEVGKVADLNSRIAARTVRDVGQETEDLAETMQSTEKAA